MLKKISWIMGSMSITMVLSGYVFKINKYEDNVLINVNSMLDKVVLNAATFQQIKPKIGKNFVYRSEKTTMSKTIINIFEHDNNYEVVLQKDHTSINDKKMKPISYLVKKVNFWDNLFNSGGD